MKLRVLKVAILVLVVGAALAVRYLVDDDYFDIHKIREHREELMAFVESHYLRAVMTFIAVYIGCALILPGALVLTVAGGMFFGVLPAVAYVNVGATVGSLIAFLLARFLMGGWIQGRFKNELASFNEEMSRHGKNYLLILRILPVAPLFVINYCAGLTKVSPGTFVWTTSLGIFPGSFIYAFLGRQLSYVNSMADLFSWKILLAFVLLALFALIPVAMHHLGGRGR